MSATLLFVGAKIASTALVARIFILTKPSLMQIAWFARAFNWFVPWKDAIYAQIRESWGLAVWADHQDAGGGRNAAGVEAALSAICSRFGKRWTGRAWPFASKERDGPDLSPK